MKGLKKAVSEMPVNGRYNGGQYLEVFYDMNEDKVFTFFHVSLGQNEWTEVDDPACIRVGMYDNKVKMAELEEDVKPAVARHNRMMEDAKSNRELDKERKAEMAEA